MMDEMVNLLGGLQLVMCTYFGRSIQNQSSWLLWVMKGLPHTRSLQPKSSSKCLSLVVWYWYFEWL